MGLSSKAKEIKSFLFCRRAQENKEEDESLFFSKFECTSSGVVPMEIYVSFGQGVELNKGKRGCFQATGMTINCWLREAPVHVSVVYGC